MVDTSGLQPRRPRDRAAAAPDGQATPGDPVQTGLSRPQLPTDHDAARQGREQSIPCHDGDQPLPTTLGAGRHASLRSRRISCHLAKGSRCARPGCSFTTTGWLLGGSVEASLAGPTWPIPPPLLSAAPITSSANAAGRRSSLVSGQSRWCGRRGPGQPYRSPDRSRRRWGRPGRRCRPGSRAAAPPER
jgi:hypothetical protein